MMGVFWSICNKVSVCRCLCVCLHKEESVYQLVSSECVLHPTPAPFLFSFPRSLKGENVEWRE